MSRARTGISQSLRIAKSFVSHAAIAAYRSASRFLWPRNCSRRNVEMQSRNQPDNSLPGNWLSITTRGAIALFLLFCIVQVARDRRELAGRPQLARSDRPRRTMGSVEPRLPRAVRANPRREKSGRRPARNRTLFAAATRLGPNRAENWAALGESLELAGNIPGAIPPGNVLHLFPRSPAINWQFANFLIRSDEPAKAASPLRTAMLGDPALRTGAFDLAWRAGMPRDEILKIIPARKDILAAYLDYLDATGRLDASAGA